MDPIAIISDVHANLHALHAVREEFATRGITRCWCLGDVVGYGAYPRETLAICGSQTERLIAGNHDLGVAGTVPIEEFSDDAATAIRWTADVLGAAGREVLSRLAPFDADDVALFHASPRDPIWEYVLSPRQAEHALIDSARHLTLVGHTHIPMAWNLTGSSGLHRIRLDQGPVHLGRGRWLVNPGSVGQPRDHDPRASWAIYHPGEETLELVRTPYDVPAAQDAIRSAGLPERLAHRLAEGR